MLRGSSFVVAPGKLGEPTLVWTTVAEFDFAQEPDQAISGGKLTLTNRVDNTTVQFDAANGVAVSSNALVLTTAAGSDLALPGVSTDTAARMDAALPLIWPDYEDTAFAWGASVAAAPSFTQMDEAWGVMVNGPVRMGGGSLGWGFSVESRHNGSKVVRQSRRQSGTTGTSTLSSAAYAAKVCGVKTGGSAPYALYSTTESDIATLNTLTSVCPVGSYGGSSGGSPIGGTLATSRLGVFACAGGGAGPNVSITKLVLRALLPVLV